MAHKYSMTIYRHIDDEGEMEEVLDKFISADHVIRILESIPDDEETEDDEEVEVEDEKEEEDPKPIKPQRGGRMTPEQKQKIVEDIEADELKPREIAEKYQVNLQSVYNLRSRMANPHSRKATDDTTQEPTTPRAHLTPSEKVRFMVEEGKTDLEIYNEMHDRMTDQQLREALAQAKA